MPRSRRRTSAARRAQELHLDPAADLSSLRRPLLLEQPLLLRRRSRASRLKVSARRRNSRLVRHRHLHVEVPARERLCALRERGEVPRHPARQRQDPDERHQPSRGRARGCAAAVARISVSAGADRPRDRDHDAGVGDRAARPPPSPPRRCASRRPGTSPRPLQHHLVDGVGRTAGPRRRARTGSAPCRRSAPERIARSSRRSSVRLGGGQRLALRLLVGALGAPSRPRPSCARAGS